jgi:transcriptional regulator with XRE-family HTH domain
MPESIGPSVVFQGRLRTAREARELSQGELALKAGLQASAVSHFETGTRKPSFDNLKRLADALKVTTDYLLGRATEMEATVATADRLHRHYSGLSAEYQEMADDFIEMLAQRAQQKKSKGEP